MQVRELMTTKVMTVKPTDTVSEVAALLIEHRFNGLPVVDESGALLGLIAERDFIASDSKIYLPTYIKILQETDFIQSKSTSLPESVQRIVKATAADVMNAEVVTVKPETELSEVTDIFAQQRVNPIPVVDGAGKLVGIIARSDLIKLFSIKHINI
jgi:CBS domain-containing protein